MLPVGLLPDIASSLGKTEAATGILLTVYAWVVAIMSLPLAVLTGRLNRRVLVLALLVVFIGSNIFSALAGTFVLLLGARLCIALAHAVFWSIATPLAARAALRGGLLRFCRDVFSFALNPGVQLRLLQEPARQPQVADEDLK